MYEIETCKHCKLENLVYFGSWDDISSPDITGFNCWNCNKKTDFPQFDEDDDFEYYTDGEPYCRVTPKIIEWLQHYSSRKFPAEYSDYVRTEAFLDGTEALADEILRQFKIPLKKEQKNVQ